MNLHDDFSVTPLGIFYGKIYLEIPSNLPEKINEMQYKVIKCQSSKSMSDEEIGQIIIWYEYHRVKIQQNPFIIHLLLVRNRYAPGISVILTI